MYYVKQNTQKILLVVVMKGIQLPDQSISSLMLSKENLQKLVIPQGPPVKVFLLMSITHHIFE